MADKKVNELVKQIETLQNKLNKRLTKISSDIFKYKWTIDSYADGEILLYCDAIYDRDIPTHSIKVGDQSYQIKWKGTIYVGTLERLLILIENGLRVNTKDIKAEQKSYIIGLTGIIKVSKAIKRKEKEMAENKKSRKKRGKKNV